MWGGGPAHLDTFDPKPTAGNDYCGPLNAPISTPTGGEKIGQLLPLLAQQFDKYSIIRSMTHGVNAHETASYIVQTGHQAGGRLVHPCLGAMVSKFAGYDAGYKGLIPPYIVLTQPQGRFSEAEFLGPRYKPFATGGDPRQSKFVVEGVVAQGISDQRQRSRRKLLDDLSSRGLLDSTIVWWSGEFGRTPKVQWDPPWNGGRGHYGRVFSAVVAGGGFRGGAIVGASDARGEEVKDRPVYPWDLLGTMYELLGIDPEGTLISPQGEPVHLTSSAEEGVESGGRLDEST